MAVFGRFTFLTKMPRELQISIAVMIFNWPMSKTGFEDSRVQGFECKRLTF